MEHKQLPNPETETETQIGGNPSPELAIWLPFHVYL